MLHHKMLTLVQLGFIWVDDYYEEDVENCEVMAISV